MPIFETISARGVNFVTIEKDFWHVTGANTLLTHNAFLGEGLIASYSAMNAANGPEFRAVTPYSHFKNGDPKEEIWEQVRLAVDPDLPTRREALFLFLSTEDAERANETWFAGEGRLIVRARLLGRTRWFVADATWLDGHEDQWEQRARRYWLGEQTDAPRHEVVVFGAVYFPEWREAPFGPMRF